MRTQSIALAGFLLLSVSTSALAQTTPAPAPEPADEAAASDTDEGQFGGIVVTALRRDMRLQEAPLSLAAFSGEFVQKTNVRDVYDLFRNIPNGNVSSNTSGRTRVSIRGIQSAGAPTVGVYYDEAPVNGPAGSSQDGGGYAPDLNLFDVERVEVLRGPQGTLYGASSMSGALRVIFKKPDSTQLEAAAEAGFSKAEGGGEGYDLRGMVNLPIAADTLALRVVGSRQVTPGFLDATVFGRDDMGAMKSLGIRAALGFTPSDAIDVTGTFHFQHRTSNNQQGWFERLGAYKTDSSVLLPFDSKLRLFDLTANWDTGPVTVTATGSHYKWTVFRGSNLTSTVERQSASAAACRTYYSLSAACTAEQAASFAAIARSFSPAVGVQYLTLKTDTAELRASSNYESALQWTAGLFYQKQDDRSDNFFNAANAITGLIDPAVPLLAGRYVASETTQKAAFLNLTLKPVDKLTLSAGARRYTYEKTVEGAVTLANPIVSVSPSPYAAASADAKGWLLNFNASYQANRNLLVYASAGQGFRPGGGNNVPGIAAGLSTYGPDKLWSYELGVKSTLLDDRLTLNAALFQTDWTNIQVSARAVSGPFSFLTNAGAARIRGGEVEANFRPTPDFELNLGIGYSNGKLTKDQVNSDIAIGGATGRAGDRLPDAPRVSITGGIEYHRPVNDDLTGFVRVDGSYRSAMQTSFRPDTDPLFERYGDDALFNLRGGVRTDVWSITLYIQNLTNRKAYNGVATSQFSKREIYSVPPRTFGVTAGTRF